MHRAAQAYLQTQVTTTNQGDVVILLFDGAVNFLNRAKECIEAKDYAGKGVLISKALDIIDELEGTLNMEKGGELARNLYNLYVLCSTKLLTASMRLDIALVDEVIAILTGIRNAFAEILTTPEAQSAAQEIAMNQQASHPARSLPAPETRHGHFASNSRVHSLYAQKTAELEIHQSVDEPTQPVGATTQATCPETMAEHSEPSASDGAGLSSLKSSPGMPSETEKKDIPSSFGGSKMSSLGLYRKFSTPGGL